MKTTLRELALLFLKLGTFAFGGPAAHIAMMEDEVVRRRRWLTRDEFLDYLGATNLIPGPNSTELAIHIGQARAGWPGLLVAGTCFILPAALIVSGVAWAYVRYGSLPLAVSLAYWIKPTVIAVVVQALWSLGRTALKTRTLIVVGIAAIAASLVGANELAVLFGAGAAMILLHWRRSALERESSAMVAIATLPIQGVAASIGSAFGLWPLFGTFVKIGSVLFGSGYVLLAFLRADFVERLHWLTERQLLDAVAVGQVTPGPVFTTATFIGYVLGGRAGAAVATIGIFLPAFIFVALSSVLLPRLRRSPSARAVLDGVNVASLALMAIVTAQLSTAAIMDATTATIAAVSMLLLFRFRVNSAWLVIGAGMAGLLIGAR